MDLSGCKIWVLIKLLTCSSKLRVTFSTISSLERVEAFFWNNLLLLWRAFARIYIVLTLGVNSLLLVTPQLFKTEPINEICLSIKYVWEFQVLYLLRLGGVCMSSSFDSATVEVEGVQGRSGTIATPRLTSCMWCELSGLSILATKEKLLNKHWFVHMFKPKNYYYLQLHYNKECGKPTYEMSLWKTKIISTIAIILPLT